MTGCTSRPAAVGPPCHRRRCLNDPGVRRGRRISTDRVRCVRSRLLVRDAAAMRLLDGPPELRLPRVFCYFDDIIGNDWEIHCPYVGDSSRSRSSTPVMITSRSAPSRRSATSVESLLPGTTRSTSRTTSRTRSTTPTSTRPTGTWGCASADSAGQLSRTDHHTPRRSQARTMRCPFADWRRCASQCLWHEAAAKALSPLPGQKVVGHSPRVIATFREMRRQMLQQGADTGMDTGRHHSRTHGSHQHLSTSPHTACAWPGSGRGNRIVRNCLHRRGVSIARRSPAHDRSAHDRSAHDRSRPDTSGLFGALRLERDRQLRDLPAQPANGRRDAAHQRPPVRLLVGQAVAGRNEDALLPHTGRRTRHRLQADQPLDGEHRWQRAPPDDRQRPVRLGRAGHAEWSPTAPSS